MKVFKFLFIGYVMALSLLIISCANDNSRNANDGTGTVEKADSTIVTATAADGTKTEVRTFKSGEVARVTRVTRSGGTRSATVEYRDGRKVELKDDGAIERVMEDTVSVIAEAGNKAWEVTKEVGKEIGDKAEDVGDKAAEAGKAVGKGAKRGAAEVADKAEDVGDKTVEGAKKVGKSIKKAVGKGN
jgi:hypothetical protein